MERMNIQDISLNESGNLKQEFCKLWPSVKNGLELLAKLVKNPIAKGAINLVISAGDTISSSICV